MKQWPCNQRAGEILWSRTAKEMYIKVSYVCYGGNIIGPLSSSPQMRWRSVPTTYVIKIADNLNVTSSETNKEDSVYEMCIIYIHSSLSTMHSLQATSANVFFHIKILYHPLQNPSHFIYVQVHDCTDAFLCHLLSPNWREAFWSHFIIFEIKWIKLLKLLKDERRSLILADPMASRKCKRETLKAKVRLLFRWLKPLNCMVAFCDQHGMRGR